MSPQSNRKTEIRKVIVSGPNQLGEHDTALRSLLYPEQCLVTGGPKHAVAIASHPSAFQDPMIPLAALPSRPVHMPGAIKALRVPRRCAHCTFAIC